MTFREGRCLYRRKKCNCLACLGLLYIIIPWPEQKPLSRSIRCTARQMIFENRNLCSVRRTVRFGATRRLSSRFTSVTRQTLGWPRLGQERAGRDRDRLSSSVQGPVRAGPSPRFLRGGGPVVRVGPMTGAGPRSHRTAHLAEAAVAAATSYGDKARTAYSPTRPVQWKTAKLRRARRPRGGTEAGPLLLPASCPPDSDSAGSLRTVARQAKSAQVDPSAWGQMGSG